MHAVYDGTQNVKRYQYRFSGTKYFLYRFWYYFWYQILLIPVPRLFFNTKFYQYRFRDFFQYQNFRYHQKTMKNSRYRYLYGTSTHYKSPKFLNFGNENQFRYQIFPIPVARLFHQIFPIPVPRHFPLPIFSNVTKK